MVAHLSFDTLFLPRGEQRRNEMADCGESLVFEIEPKHPYSKNDSSANENLLHANLGFHVG